MRAWARPVTVTWATSPDSVLVTTCGFGQRAGTGGGDEALGRLGSGGWRRAVAGGHLAALLGCRPGQVAGVGPQGVLDPADDQQEEDGEADDELRQPGIASTAVSPMSVPPSTPGHRGVRHDRMASGESVTSHDEPSMARSRRSV